MVGNYEILRVFLMDQHSRRRTDLDSILWTRILKNVQTILLISWTSILQDFKEVRILNTNQYFPKVLTIKHRKKNFVCCKEDPNPSFFIGRIRKFRFCASVDWRTVGFYTFLFSKIVSFKNFHTCYTDKLKKYLHFKKSLCSKISYESIIIGLINIIRDSF